jgi:phosphocarrier protein HPr
MASATVTLHNEVGLHARPASRFVETAKGFTAEISVTKDGRSANAKSMLTLLTLDVRKGDTIDIDAEGADADEAVAALVELVASL